jgi:nitrate reductase beta subunit
VGCYPAVEQGYQPMCVQNCIGKIRIMGFVTPPWRARADNPVDFLVHKAGLALPYYPQLGLEPNIYYIPPVHADRAYLRQMFGPLVDRAIANYHRVKDDLVAQGLLVLMGSTDRILHSFRVEDGQAIGFGEDGAEIVRVPVTEPLHERAAWNEQLQAVRTNTP